MSGSVRKSRTALVVHGDLGIVSGLQDALVNSGFNVISARDLPTALLAATQHYFDLILVSSRVAEEGDGWPLAGVLHMVFRKSYIAVITPYKNVISLQAAINHGANQVFEFKTNPADVVGAILQKIAPLGSMQ